MTIPDFEHEMANTRKTLARLTDERLGWRPHASSWTAAELATHMTSIPGWGIAALSADSFDMAPGGQVRPSPPALDTVAALLETFDRNLEAMSGLLELATEKQMRAEWTLRAGDRTVFAMPRAAVLRGAVLNHVIHHRGQLTVYLRMMGLPVPALYGPSADEA